MMRESLIASVECAKAYDNNCFFIVLARDQKHVAEKIAELQYMNVPFIVICGEEFNHPNVVYRKAIGKWDAVNFSASLIPSNKEIIVFNDVDTQIHNFENAYHELTRGSDLIYCKVRVPEGPQVKFYKILDPIRKYFHIAASGECLLIKQETLKGILPVPPCMAEDSYILFKALELGYHARFCTTTYVTTKRTADASAEEAYKNRTTLGIYQALNYANPPRGIRIFYILLPLFAPLLILAGKDGRAWFAGISKAVKDSLTDRNPVAF